MNKENAQAIIECRGLDKTYHDGDRELRILRGIDLTVREGEMMVITGPSGVGKSTLLHIIGALDHPTAGEVMFRGNSLKKLKRSALNRIRNEEIGFVFQFYHLLPEFTALENVMMPALSRGKRRSACAPRAKELLDTVGLTERMTHRPGQLSGGEQQRVAIARALYNKPSVVLADEPTGNLDEHTGEEVIKLLCDLNKNKGVTLVMVTHDENLSTFADRWIHMHEGKATQKKG